MQRRAFAAMVTPTLSSYSAAPSFCCTPLHSGSQSAFPPPQPCNFNSLFLPLHKSLPLHTAPTSSFSAPHRPASSHSYICTSASPSDSPSSLSSYSNSRQWDQRTTDQQPLYSKNE